MPPLPELPSSPCVQPSSRLALLHGWGLGPGVWAGAFDALAPATPRRLALPGYACTPDPGEDFQACADRLAAELPEGSVLCAWSLGGQLALQAALAHPGHWRGLVLVGATPCFVRAHDWPHAQAATVLDEFSRGVAQAPEAALIRFAALVHQGDARARALTRASQQQVRTAGAALPTTNTLHTGLAWLRDTDLRSSLSALDLPCLLVHGDQDAVVPLPAAQALAASLPRARLAVLPGAAHAPFLSDPDWFAHQVLAFCHDPNAA